MTSAGLVDALLQRVAEVDAPGTPVALRSLLALSDTVVDEAGQRDRERAAGRVRGPLHGVPVVVKDNIEVAGLPGSAGSLALAARPVVHDAPIVTRLRDAGAVILGAANLSEWANFRSPDSTSGWSAVGGLTGNPWALDRSPGGSSSGSGAALAAGLSPLALGTETNGSITCPASLNGVVGLKPTVGSLPRTGIVPISVSQDSPGPMARSVTDVATLWAVLSGVPGAIGAAHPDRARPLTVAVARTWMTGHDRTDALFAEVTGRLVGAVAALTACSPPPVDDAVERDQIAVLIAEQADDLDAYLAARPGDGVRSLAELVGFNSAHAAQELAYFGQQYLEQSLASTGRRGPQYAAARAANVAWAEGALDTALTGGADVLLAPAYAPAWKSDLAHVSSLAGGGMACMAPSIMGWPILTLPLGLVDGLPVGITVIGRPGSESRLLAMGSLLESLIAFSDQPTWQPPTRG